MLGYKSDYTIVFYAENKTVSTGTHLTVFSLNEAEEHYPMKYGQLCVKKIQNGSAHLSDRPVLSNPWLVCS